MYVPAAQSRITAENNTNTDYGVKRTNFFDYLFSDEAQQLVAKAYLLPRRSDVKCEGRTNPEDIPQIECDWDKMMEITSDSAAKINELCQ